MWRRILAIIICVAFLFSMTACGCEHQYEETTIVEPTGSVVDTGEIDTLPNTSTAEYVLSNIRTFTDDYTWIEYNKDGKGRYAVSDINGNCIIIIENETNFYPKTGFMHGVTYVESNGNDFVINTAGEVVISAVKDNLGEIVAYGCDEGHAYFMFQKHVADFASAHEEYIIFDEQGTIIKTITSDTAYYDAWYCGETVWAFEKSSNIWGHRLCQFYNHENDLFFDVDGLLHEPGYPVCHFSSDYAANYSGWGDPVFINCKTGAVTEWRQLEGESKTIGKVSNGIVVISAYNSYDIDKENKPIHYFGYINPKDGTVKYIEDEAIVNRMYAQDVRDNAHYLFDQNGHMLIKMTGAEALQADYLRLFNYVVNGINN